MARLGGLNGSITMPTGFGAADAAAFDVDVSYGVENDTAYGDVNATHVSNACAEFRYSVLGFVRKDIANSNPFSEMTATAVTSVSTNVTAGTTALFTFDTGCTLQQKVVCERVSVSHARRQAAATIRYSFAGSGVITSAWDVA
jgi:hypothetical protein